MSVFFQLSSLTRANTPLRRRIKGNPSFVSGSLSLKPVYMSIMGKLWSAYPNRKTEIHRLMQATLDNGEFVGVVSRSIQEDVLIYGLCLIGSDQIAEGETMPLGRLFQASTILYGILECPTFESAGFASDDECITESLLNEFEAKVKGFIAY